MAAAIKILKSSDDEDDASALDTKKTICGICVEKESRYTCPRCNIAYCSLDCYRDKKHEGCSESFYRDCVIEDMKERSIKPEDRQKILQMLANEHEQQVEDSDDDVPDLSDRLEGLDLDADAGEVWRRLTDREREDFARMMKDGRLANLVSVWTPWWMTQTQSKVVQETTGDSLPAGFPPHLPDIPDLHIIVKTKPASEVKYNIVNVISAYAFITRLHNGDYHHCPVDCAEELLKVCDVLKDNVNFPGSREAVHSVIQHVQQAGSGFVVPPSFSVVLLGDVVRILQGPRLSPLASVLSALSDLLTVVKAASKELKKVKGKKKKSTKSRPSSDNSTEPEDDTSVERQLFLAKKKLTFHLSWSQRLGMCLSSLCPELSLELDCVKSEASETKSLQTAVEKGLRAGKLQPSQPAPKVQEIS